MPKAVIIVGSESDLPYLWESSLLDRLDSAGIDYEVSVCSAHRNADDLKRYVARGIKTTAVYVTAAGWAAALPGAVKALLLRDSLADVYGIALPSREYPEGHDAEISILRLPPGIDVKYGGVGTKAFNGIAGRVIASANSYDPAKPDLEELERVRAKIKQPKFDIPRPGQEA